MDTPWFNSQGYFFEGNTNIRKFHEMLASRKNLDYAYKAGVPRIRLVDSTNAIAYYAWKMTWFRGSIPEIIENEEVGLMTLTARKRGGEWR